MLRNLTSNSDASSESTHELPTGTSFSDMMASLGSHVEGFRKMQQVTAVPGLWIGPMIAARDLYKLQDAGIHALLAANGQQPALLSYVPTMAIKVVDIEDEADEDIATHFNDCFAFLDQALQRGGVLVYCTAGMSRSATIVIAYLMHKQRCPVALAYAQLHESRRWIKPNAGFMEQLRKFEGTVLARPPLCDLCELRPVTRQYLVTDKFAIVECDACDLPMIVLRGHCMHVPVNIQDEMRRALCAIADAVIGKGNWKIDTHQRTISSHFHWHARPLTAVDLYRAKL